MDQNDVTAEQTETRRGRRAGRGRRQVKAYEQPDWRQPRLTFPPVELVSADQLEAIHDASIRIASEFGLEVVNDEAREIFERAGAIVDHSSQMVRFDAELVEEAVKTAPAEFKFHARNPARTLNMGGDWIAYCAIGSAPNSSCLDHGRRTGNRKDFQTFLKLGHMLNAIHIWGGYPVEPIDLHPSIRHLEALWDLLTFSDKCIHAYSLSVERNRDAIEMIRIARGITDDELDREPSLVTIVNTNSPLKVDGPMGQGIIEMARRNQITVVTPFTLAGAMAPVTLAGALAQQNAEALFGLVLTQLVRPGSPFIYGGFTSNVDMKSGAPAFGTPEYMKGAIVGGQLARRYGVPYRSSNVNAANGLDMQAAYESVFSLWGAITGGCNFLKHGAGWMEGGLQASFEKFVMDADLLQMVSSFLEPLEVNDDTLGLDAIREVGPGGHFFGCAHTQARYQNAFFAPMISDWRNYETWDEAGRPDAAKKANEIYKAIVADYEEPPIDPAIREELRAFVDRRIAEGGAPTDF